MSFVQTKKLITSAPLYSVLNRDNRIDFGLLLQQSIKSGKPIPKINIDDVGYANVLGRRTYNEDFYRAMELKPNSSSTSIMYFAIFDGHGGHLCAQL